MPATDEVYDIAIIGGGVVGCAALFHLTNQGYRCLLLEKNKHLVAEASSGNSGMLHTGFDAPLNSLELSCIQETQKIVFGVLDKLHLPYNQIGATMVAWNEQQRSQLDVVYNHSKETSVSDIQRLSLSELYEREPNLSRNAHGALHIPGETIVDPWLTPVVFAMHAQQRGAKIQTCTLVGSLDFDGTTKVWNLNSNRQTFKSRIAINCGGLYGDIVNMLAGKPNFKIKPRKGQYLVFEKGAKNTISSSILPVPTETTKGVIVFKSVYGNVVIGPTAEEIPQRVPHPVIDDDITRRLKMHGMATVPPLMKYNIFNMYTGVRPATENKEYQIFTDVERNFITVGGIRSTGLSGCLGIANHVEDLVENSLGYEPSSMPYKTLETLQYTLSKGGGSVVFLDGSEHYVTHPLTYTGLFDNLVSNL